MNGNGVIERMGTAARTAELDVRASKSAVVPAPPVSARRERILAAFDITIPANRVPTAYVALLGVLAVTLALLAAAFVGLLVFLGWLVVWHVASAAISLPQGPYFVFHLPMALLAGFLLLFLVKPLFFRGKGEEQKIVTLTPGEEPLLFEAVGRLCAAIGTKPPTLIEVDCNPNAAALFRGGGLRAVAGRNLVLRIGLPLAAAMPVRQFAGVLAHELGHFRQQHGMVWSYLIRRVNFFFARVVFQRDKLDAWLIRLRRQRNHVRYLVYLAAAALVEPTRGLLWLMYVVGEVLSCRVMQRMEYDADAAEAHVAGGAAFRETSLQLTMLQIAAEQVRSDLGAAFDTGRLADDLPQMINRRFGQLSAHADEIHASLNRQSTNWFDTHPSHPDRVRHVESLSAPGKIHADWPAGVLFRDFGGLCKRATAAHYRAVLGDGIKDVKLVSTAELVREQTGVRDAVKDVRRYFQDHLLASRPVLPDDAAALPPDDVSDADACAEQLLAARDRMLALAAAVGPAMEDYEVGSGQCAAANAELLMAPLASSYDACQKIRAAANASLNDAVGKVNRALTTLSAFEAAARQRLTWGLRLLHVHGDAAAVADAARWVALCDPIRRAHEAVLAARDEATKIHVMYGAFDPKQPYRPLEVKILETMAAAVATCRQAVEAFGDVPYPFEHATEGATCAAFLLPKTPDDHDVGQVMDAAMGLSGRYADLALLVLSKLVGHAERVEAALGLSTLETPDHKAERDERRRKADADDRKESRRYWFWYGLRAVAGCVLLATTVYLSVYPPALPQMPWDDGRPGGVPYRPAGFSYSSAARPLTVSYQPSAPPGQPNWYRPGNPGYYQPGHPGYQQGMPTYFDRGYGSYYSPNQPGAMPGVPQESGIRGSLTNRGPTAADVDAGYPRSYTPPNPQTYRPPSPPNPYPGNTGSPGNSRSRGYGGYDPTNPNPNRPNSPYGGAGASPYGPQPGGPGGGGYRPGARP
jgi:Zn-dependent protease with chaperone function